MFRYNNIIKSHILTIKWRKLLKLANLEIKLTVGMLWEFISCLLKISEEIN